MEKLFKHNQEKISSQEELHDFMRVTSPRLWMLLGAIAPKPRILIFDEATSALDNKTQKQVSDALDKLNCTRIVIAHRLSTVRNCSRILVMDQGAIVEEGKYEELIEKGGVFAELVARQRLDAGETAKLIDSLAV